MLRQEMKLVKQAVGGGEVEGKADHKNRFFLHCTEEFELLKKKQRGRILSSRVTYLCFRKITLGTVSRWEGQRMGEVRGSSNILSEGK